LFKSQLLSLIASKTSFGDSRRILSILGQRSLCHRLPCYCATTIAKDIKFNSPHYEKLEAKTSKMIQKVEEMVRGGGWGMGTESSGRRRWRSQRESAAGGGRRLQREERDMDRVRRWLGEMRAELEAAARRDNDGANSAAWCYIRR
jgi:hypothetical protein